MFPWDPNEWSALFGERSEERRTLIDDVLDAAAVAADAADAASKLSGLKLSCFDSTA